MQPLLLFNAWCGKSYSSALGLWTLKAVCTSGSEPNALHGHAQVFPLPPVGSAAQPGALPPPPPVRLAEVVSYLSLVHPTLRSSFVLLSS